ncbi:MAG: hypothetical protein MUP17_07170 [candidate division Zixibacteria bacterium]|nr:hypothetical protein [candidate division Zixibacteria bacterium]
MFRISLKLLLLSGFIFLLSFSLTCKKPDTPSYTDVDAIKDYINYNPDIFLADVFDTLRVAPFFREITNKDYWIGIVFHNPDSINFLKSADVSWEDSIQGVFHTFISGKEYLKNFKAFSRVKAYFEQWGNSGDLYRGWLLIKISNVQIYSPLTSVGFGNLQFDTSGASNNLSLSGLFELKNVLQLRKSTSVTFTIEPLYATDRYYLHIYEGGAWKKIPFTQGTGNDFSASWTTGFSTQDLNVYKHAYIDGLSSKTVDDTLSRYNSNAWGIIYKIK